MGIVAKKREIVTIFSERLLSDSGLIDGMRITQRSRAETKVH
ncbi:MAG: hypothetical protein BECKG1743D_GA0114223_104342 [Candidatus Kentron sp. G]|nr:MAG: hypothetical protein BECKG1743E_GA0114224_104313 [Candidatus Kentron sp. G]VFN03121.1 MAG: hypothetical protein BECKG1743D_GA0114223_104342 [Candidatus Kentron sp. G]